MAMRNFYTELWSNHDLMLQEHAKRRQKQPNIFERFVHRDFLRAGWSVEQMLAETTQDVYAKALLEDELQDFPDDVAVSPFPPDSLRSWGMGFLWEHHKERDGRYTYEGYVERIDIANQLRKRHVLDELVEAVDAAGKLFPESNSVKSDFEFLLEDLRLYRGLTEYHSVKRFMQDEVAMFTQVLEIIADAFGTPCSWEGVMEQMRGRPGAWCADGCGSMAHSTCWRKFLEQKMLQKQRAGNFCHKQREG